jgi:hypothetical protein
LYQIDERWSSWSAQQSRFAADLSERLNRDHARIDDLDAKLRTQVLASFLIQYFQCYVCLIVSYSRCPPKTSWSERWSKWKFDVPPAKQRCELSTSHTNKHRYCSQFFSPFFTLEPFFHTHVLNQSDAAHALKLSLDAAQRATEQRFESVRARMGELAPVHALESLSAELKQMQVCVYHLLFCLFVPCF